MGARTMFAKFKSGTGIGATPLAPNILEFNPIWNSYEIGKQIGTAGPEGVWRILDGYRKSDGKDVAIFLFEKRSVEKIHKPKRKDIVTDVLRNGVKNLETFRHPKVLQIMSSLEECPETLAFVSEPVIASLANVLAAKEQRLYAQAAQMQGMPPTGMPTGMNHHNHHQQGYPGGQPQPAPGQKPTFVNDYELLDIELKYGLLQTTEALGFLHYTHQMLHRNVCPTSIIITKKGTWKLFGFEFVEKVNEQDGTKPVPLPQWTNRATKLSQPNLDYLAPEVQQKKMGSIYSDMYSLGMLMWAVFNHGRPLVQANHNVSDYLKQIETLEETVLRLVHMIPPPLQEAVCKLLQKTAKKRPHAQALTGISYFKDPSVYAMQFLDVINMKDPGQKSHFYKNTLKEALPYIPRKLWYQHIWVQLFAETKSQEVFAAVLLPMLWIIQHSSEDEYEQLLMPTFRLLFNAPRSIQGSVVLLENLSIVLEKSPLDNITREVLPILFNSFESNTIQIQTAAFVAVPSVVEYLDDGMIRRTVLQKVKMAFKSSTIDQRILMKALASILERLETQQILDDVLPLLRDCNLQEPEIIVRVVGIYRIMLTDKKYGLSVNMLATRIMPSLLPQTVNPGLKLEHFTSLLEVLQEMLNTIDRNQRNKLKLDNMSLLSPERFRPLRHQYSTDNMPVPPFNIPNVRIEQRKTSSAEDMNKRNSLSGSMSMTASAENMTTRKSSMAGLLGSWLNSANDSNYLRVNNLFTNRRLSDNTLITPKIRLDHQSCASSPGGTPGSGLPVRRHSSTSATQERRGSNTNLSPPTFGRYSPQNFGGFISSNSVPYLSTSLNSIRSRRTSVTSTSSQQGPGLFSNVYELFRSRT